MSEYFPATHSTLSAQDLKELISKNYKIGSSVSCTLLHRGLNDTYWLKTDSNSYTIRVYRTGWRSLSEISYELEVLLHLHQRGAHVSIPQLRNDNELVTIIEAIEGPRYAVLFTFANGREPNYEGESQAIQYGRAVATIHAETDFFCCRHSRFALDLDHLLSDPMKAIRPLLERRADDWKRLVDIEKRLHIALQALPLERLDYGFCHGDFNGGNASFSDDGMVTLYDFDCCGRGWRSYDIAVFRWCTMLHGKEKELWLPFLEGYREVRELKQIDLDAVRYFVGVRHIWMMGLHAANAFDLGYAWINDSYYDHQMRFLRKWETEQFNDRNAG
jgi:Ser/Thr protein kinase RdoA (MazF antagonist)